MIKKEVPKKTFSEVLSEYQAVFSISLRNGYANIDFEGNEFVATFLDEEGMNQEERISVADLEKVSKFIQCLKDMRLPEHSLK